MKIKVGLLGFGKAGKAVASILLLRKETELVWVLKNSAKSKCYSVPEFLGVESDEPGLIFSKSEWTAAQLLDKYPVDIIVDFSSSEGISFYGEEARKREIAIVSAISEYSDDKISYIKQLSKETKVLWSPNITIGINFLMIAAKILKKIAPYTDIEIIEEHFRDKKEISGTAKKIASNLDIKSDQIKSIRAGGIIGRHEILFGFPYQTVRLLHESISREAFGNGALFAALALVDKEKGLYSMEDLLSPYFSIN
jgi:4-hydroxy-tetrahydrodipicolinate reductase